MDINFEFAIFGIPQQNDRVRQQFAKLYSRIGVVLNGEKFSFFLRNGLWAETANNIMLWIII